jgi:hypothetical protein
VKVYLDLVFIVNFGINFLFIGIIQVIFNENLNIKRGIISSAFASLFLIVFFFDYLWFSILKVIGGVFLIWIGIGLEKIVIKSSLFYLLEYGLTGIVNSYRISGWYLIIALFFLIILLMVQSFKNQSIFLNSFKYNVSVTLSGRVINMTGFLDTGNLVTINNLPVVFLDNKYFKTCLEVYKTTSIQTVNNYKEIICYEPDAFLIKIRNRKLNKKVLIVFTDLDKEFDCLLNYNIFT